MRRLGAVLAAVAFVAAGCGGDDDGDGGNGSGSASAEEAAVFKGLTDYAEAVRENDPAAACDRLTSRAQDEAADTLPGATSCEDAHRQALGVLGEANRKKLADQLGAVKNYEAKISEDEATLEFPGRAGAKPVKMRRVGGEWKVDQNTLFFNPNKGG